MSGEIIHGYQPRDKMEAEYVGYYLGTATPTKGTTGLGVIQKPLREKYFSFRKSADNKLGPEVGIRVNPRGIILLFPGGHPAEPNDQFYEISSIHFIEAVRFVTRKQKDKKLYGAFVPIDDDEANPNQDKLFEQIEKKFKHLEKISHPPMLACVMRRPTGIKAVDCHMFVIPVIEDALRIADMVHRFQERPDNPEFYYGGRPPPDPRDMPPEPDVIPRNLGQPFRDREPALGPGPGPGPGQGQRPRDSEDYAYLYKGRGFELKQEHFNGKDDDPRRQEQPNRSIERDRLPLPGDDPQRYGPMRGRPGSLELRGGPRDDPYPERRPKEFLSPDGRYIERDSFGGEYEFDNRVVHERQRPGGDRDIDRFSGERRMLSPRNEFPASPRNDLPLTREHTERKPDNYPGRFSDSSFDQHRGPPPWQDRRSTGGDPRILRDYEEAPYSRPYRGEQQRSPPHSPRGRSPQRASSPPRGQPPPREKSPNYDDQIYSASNLESRLEEQQSGKPVAKVPPNRHVGVRVLPTLPIADAKNRLKPVSPRISDPPTKVEEKPPSYNLNIKPEPEEENPYDNAPDRYLHRHNRPTSDISPLVQRRGEGYGQNPRVKSDDFGGHSYPDDYGYKNTAQQYNKQWSYEDEKEKFLKNREDGSGGGWGNANNSKPDQGGFSGVDYGKDLNERGGRHMKDMEIENMFSKMRTSNPPGQGDLDFERGLGYLP